MGGFDKVMFSKVQGVVLKNGKPIAGAKVTRYYKWGATDDEKTEETSTDKNGNFSFPSTSKFSILRSMLPHEPVIFQEIIIHHEGEKYTAWRFTKHDYGENDELDGTPINLKCELTQEKGFLISKNKKVFGIATLNQN